MLRYLSEFRLKRYVVLIIGNSKSFHLGAQGTFKSNRACSFLQVVLYYFLNFLVKYYLFFYNVLQTLGWGARLVKKWHMQKLRIDPRCVSGASLRQLIEE